MGGGRVGEEIPPPLLPPSLFAEFLRGRPWMYSYTRQRHARTQRERERGRQTDQPLKRQLSLSLYSLAHLKLHKDFGGDLADLSDGEPCLHVELLEQLQQHLLLLGGVGHPEASTHSPRSESEGAGKNVITRSTPAPRASSSLRPVSLSLSLSLPRARASLYFSLSLFV